MTATPTIPASTLAQFIRVNLEPIAAEWEAFARELTPDAAVLSDDELRDHVPQLLHAVADDIEVHRSAADQQRSARGLADADVSPAITAYARQHAQTRISHGFTVHGMSAEYRALRETVLRLWDVEAHEGLAHARDHFRFDQGIDHALIAAMQWFGQELDKARDFFLAALAHDLRNPLGAVQMAARLLLVDPALGQESAQAAQRVLRSSARMRGLVDQLLDFTRIRLGHRLPVRRERADFGTLLSQIADELRTYHAGVDVRVTTAGALVGTWDRMRIAQVVSNLVGNAIEHGELGRPVTATARGEAENIIFTVHNEGEPIAPDLLPRLLDPGARAAYRPREGNADSDSMGLGLVIARQIVDAHGGRIRVVSTAQDGTTFIVTLPKDG